LPTPVKHNLIYVGNETLPAVAFFAAAMLKQNMDNVMMPAKSHVLETPNLEGWVERYGFGGAAGFAASPGFGGAAPAGAPPGISSSGAARISCSTNDSG
jgi:hypothetical protein